MKKKLFLFTAVIGLFLLLTGCVSATVEAKLELTDKSGAGSKTITFVIPQDRETLIETRDETDEQGRTLYDYTIYNNSTYFPKGYQAFADFVVSKLPSNGYTAAVREDSLNVYIDFTYSFTSFAEYTEKTKALAGDRWNECEFVDPQLYVSKVQDAESENFGMYELTFAESKHLTNACVYNLLEIGFSNEAIVAGVYTPFGDSLENPDCKDMYRDYYATESFREFAITYFMGVPGNVCETSALRSYKFEDAEYTEMAGEDGKISVYITEDEARSLGIALTDQIPPSLGRTPKKPQSPNYVDAYPDEETESTVESEAESTVESETEEENGLDIDIPWLLMIAIIAVGVVSGLVTAKFSAKKE